jgi:hypothetical protein
MFLDLTIFNGHSTPPSRQLANHTSLDEGRLLQNPDAKSRMTRKQMTKLAYPKRWIKAAPK